MDVKWVMALASFIALGIAGIHYGVFVHIPGGSSAQSIENTLQTNAIRSLKLSDIDWAKVTIRGQMAHLSGVAPSKVEHEKTHELILRSMWRGGIILGGITTVRSGQVVIAKPETQTLFDVVNVPSVPDQELPEPVSVTEAEKIDDADQCQDLFAKALADNTIHFETSKADVSTDSFVLLDSLAQIMIQCFAFEFLVTGHTDWLGDPAFNDWLSAQRAQKVKNYLIDKGKPETQISSRGIGSREPVCQENTRSCRSRNRRIEITVK